MSSMNITSFENNNSKNALLSSEVPSKCLSEPCMFGVDEAGRGPVLGPMVYGAAYCPVSCLDELKTKGFADSKTLTEDKRENLFTLINQSEDMLGWILEIHSPNVISNSMLKRSKYNLNALSHDSAIKLLKEALFLGVNVVEAYFDTVGPPEKYEAKLSALFPDIKITVSKKADSIFPIVSAASICAKVARDNALKSWQFSESIENQNYGSGYPNDPATKKFLSENIDPVFGFTQLVRFSWSTAQKLLEKEAVNVTWEEEDDENAGSNSVTLSHFFQKRKLTPELKPKNHSYFTQRSLSQVESL